LLNALTSSQVLAEDKLFATLDASVRALDPDCHPPIVAIDTVGFIRKLPHGLVASFRSTLEEVCEADLILHVLDGGSSQVQEEMQVTLDVLKDLGADQKPRITVFNKSDTVQDISRKNWAKIASPGSIWISALNSEDVARVRQMILQHFRSTLELVELFIPYGESKIESQLFECSTIEKKTFLDNGTFYRIKISAHDRRRLMLDRYLTGVRS
jgi:GTP-binding protein HflX